MNDRAKLITGSLVSVVMSCDLEWANDVIRQLETLTGIHGLFNSHIFTFSYLILCDLKRVVCFDMLN